MHTGREAWHMLLFLWHYRLTPCSPTASVWLAVCVCVDACVRALWGVWGRSPLLCAWLCFAISSLRGWYPWKRIWISSQFSARTRPRGGWVGWKPKAFPGITRRCYSQGALCFYLMSKALHVMCECRRAAGFHIYKPANNLRGLPEQYWYELSTGWHFPPWIKIIIKTRHIWSSFVLNFII